MHTPFPMEPPFAGSYLKVARARGFIAELERELEAYTKSNPVSGIPDFGNGQIRVEWKPIGGIPGAIVGDAIHNLRAALDLMASELARRNQKSDKDVYFPFAASKETLGERITAKNFDRAGPAAVEMLWQFAPYKGGNEALRAIHDLDIQDKHTAMVLIGTATTIEFMATYHLEHRGEDRLSLVATEIDYGFPTGIWAGRKVLETLKQLVELTTGIVEAFEALSAPAGPSPVGRHGGG